MRLAALVSGGKDSLSLLYLLNKIASKKLDFKLSALLVNEGIKGYRDETIKTAKNFCEKNNIQLHIATYKEITGKTLDSIKKQFPDTIACSMCGVLRRYILNKKSRELKADKLATGHNLDDEAQAIIMNIFKANTDIAAHLGPISGINNHSLFVQRVKPLYFCTEKETKLYSLIKKFPVQFIECPYANEGLRSNIRDMLNDFETKYKGTKQGIINSFLAMLPLLKQQAKQNFDEIKICQQCQEPAHQDICNTCKIQSLLT